jgi:hypothetical protein
VVICGVVDPDEGIPYLPEILAAFLIIMNCRSKYDFLDARVDEGKIHFQGFIIAIGTSACAVIFRTKNGFVRRNGPVGSRVFSAPVKDEKSLRENLVI